MNRRAADARAPVPVRMAFALDWSTAFRHWQGSYGGRCLLFAALLSMLVLLPSGCRRVPEEQRLREAIAAMEQAAEARQPGAVVEWVSDDFVGSHGLDREQLRRLLQARMFGRAAVGVTLGPLQVELQDSYATVRFVALLTGGSGGLLPDQARGYRVTSEWRLEDGDWRVHRADWEPERD